MTENLSMNIKDYTDQDLLNILNLSDDCSEFEIKQATNSLIKSMKKANKQDLVNFFTQVKTYLLDKREPDYAETYNKQFDESTVIGNMYGNAHLSQNDSTQTDKYTDRKQKVAFFQENTHMPMTRQRLGVQQTHNIDVAQGNMNPLLRTTTKRIANIDSQYRPNIYPYVNNNPDSVTSSTSFTINLSEPLNNAISSTLYSIQIPRTWYVFDENLGNTCFWLKIQMKLM